MKKNKKSFKKLSVTALMILVSLSIIFLAKLPEKPSSLIFFHPDGMGVNTWSAIRISKSGADGKLNWDHLPNMAIYTGHMKDNLTATSNGGATTHAYGVKVSKDSYGIEYKKSIMYQAQKAGKSIGIVNSGTITEPGTGAFLAYVKNRHDHNEIAKQIIESNADVIFGGGEKYFLPETVKGHHDFGARKDNLNLIELAKKRGYKVIYTKEELFNLPKDKDAKKVLGLFASNHTFNDLTEEELKRQKKSLFNKEAPTIANMIEFAIKTLSRNKKGFFLVAEEEATDNFANKNNATGVIEAGKRSDVAIGVLISYINFNKSATMITTSDSDAGGMQLIGVDKNIDYSKMPVDGVDGDKNKPFISCVNYNKGKLPFYVLWTSKLDLSGGIIARAIGRNSQKVNGIIDNTEIYQFMHDTLFTDD